MSKPKTSIHKPNIFYFLLKSYQLLVFHLFYKKVEVIGRKNIAYRSPMIFTPNHQNALMDALIVLDTAGMNVVFMARADIFKRDIFKKILTFLKILPIYRIRDGVEELSKNDSTFDTCIDILKDRESVCLMPEGNHGDQRRIRPLVKGTFRIAFKAQEDFGDQSPVKIIPVGIDFEDYVKIRQNILVIYGEPIEVGDYMEAYRENPARTINAIKDKLSEEMKKLVIHISNDEHYQMFQDLRTIYNSRMRNRLGIRGSSLYKKFRADKQMISILDERCISDPENIKTLAGQVEEYRKGLKSLNLRHWVIEKKGYSFVRIILQSLLLIIGLPVFISGWISNIIPYTLPQRLIRNIKDPQFHNSVKFGISLLFFPIYYAVIASLAGIFSDISGIGWMVFFAMPVLGYLAFEYVLLYKKLVAAVRYRLLCLKKDERILQIVSLQSSIVSDMNEIVESYDKAMIPKEKQIL